jgi:hypothetical protein
MAQIWLTFEELAAHAECSVERARDEVFTKDWARRQCSDGQTRVKLPPDLAHAYILAYAAHHNGGKTVGDMLSTLQAALDDAGMLSKEFYDSVRKRPAEEPDRRHGQKGLLRRAS